MAEIATGNRDEALDILQDAMMKLVERYADKSTAEWGPLFTSILQSRIKDWYRRHKVRRGVFAWFSKQENQADDPVEAAHDENVLTPEQSLQANRRVDVLEHALRALPLRQQQAFLLRNWEGLSVEETAQAMQLSTGSVKTHYSRAIHSLRERLGDHWSQT